jgi:hypothetical protein
MIDGNAREILECAGDYVKIVAHPANARIRRESRDDGIFEHPAAW